METLSNAKATTMPGLVSAEEVYAIQQNILNEHFANVSCEKNYCYRYVSYDDTLKFISDAAVFSEKILGSMDAKLQF